MTSDITQPPKTSSGARATEKDPVSQDRVRSNSSTGRIRSGTGALSRHSSTAVEQGSSAHYSTDSRSSGSTLKKKPISMPYQGPTVTGDSVKRKTSLIAPKPPTPSSSSRPTRPTVSSSNGYNSLGYYTRKM